MSNPIKASSAIASQPETNPKDLTEPGKELLPKIEVALVEQGIKQQHSPHRVHFTAIKNWLRKYQPSAGISNLEQVGGYLEAF